MKTIENQMSWFDGDKKLTNENKPIRLITLFSGYDSQALSLKYLGVPFEHYKTSEWAIPSIQALKDLHFESNNVDYAENLTDNDLVNYFCEHNISADYNIPLTREKLLKRKDLRRIFNNAKNSRNLLSICNIKGKDLEIVDTDKYFYLLTYSFPCQDISSAGVMKGFTENSGTRSGLLWEVKRLLQETEEKPQCLIMENVADILTVNNIENFSLWIKFLDSLGYKSKWQILNGKDFGIPQNRERCFCISWLGDYYYYFPQNIKLEKYLKDLLEEKVNEKYYLSEKTVNMFVEHTKKKQKQGCGFKFKPTSGGGTPIVSQQGKGNELTTPLLKNGLLLNNKKIKSTTNVSSTLQAHYSKGITSFEKQFDTGVLEYDIRANSKLEE